MVRKGEYLERSVVIPGDVPLEGLYHRGTRSPGLIIVPPHPSEGSMESAIIAELAWAVTRAGHPTLRFNYRGVGASPGRFDEGKDSPYVDLLKAAHHLRVSLAGGEDETLPPIAAVGLGLGAALASRLALESGIVVSPLILIQPDLGRLPRFDATHPGGAVVALCSEEEAEIELPYARCARVPGTDRRFLRGLVELGKVVAQTLSPGGSLDLLARVD